jgi:hypothetical protein
MKKCYVVTFSNRKFKKNFVIKFKGLDPNPTSRFNESGAAALVWYYLIIPPLRSEYTRNKSIQITNFVRLSYEEF